MNSTRSISGLRGEVCSPNVCQTFGVDAKGPASHINPSSQGALVLRSLFWRQASKMPGMQIEPRYKHVCIDREAVAIRCWLVPTGGPGDGDTVTLWELRRVLNTIWGAAVDTCKFLRHHKAEIQHAMAHAGL